MRRRMRRRGMGMREGEGRSGWQRQLAEEEEGDWEGEWEGEWEGAEGGRCV